MAEPSKGRGRGLAMIEAMRKAQMDSSTPSRNPSQHDIPGPSVTPSQATSIVSNLGKPSFVGGRGRSAALLLAKIQQQSPGPSYSPASDVAPPGSKTAGRGMKIIQNLLASQASCPSTVTSDVDSLTKKMAESTVSAMETTITTISIPKNKHFDEIKKNTNPIVRKGETGTPVDVTANFIYLNFKENIVYEYEVCYEPQQDYKYLCFKLLNEHIHYFKDKTFDGTTLYVPRELSHEALNLISTNPYDNSKVNITIKFRRPRRLSEMIHIYNVLFKNIMKDLNLVRFGRQFFNESAAVQIPQHKLEIWPGYVTAVDEYEGGLMLTLDSTHRVLRTQDVLSFIKESAVVEGSDWKRKVTNTLVGCSVMTTYNKKLFRIDSVDNEMTPRSTFDKMVNGEIVKISYIDYYKNNYGIDIMDWTQPMLISRDTKRMPGSEKTTDFLICLVPELCQLTGLTDDQRSNFRLMKDVATYTRITPNQRHYAFRKYIESVLENDTARKRLEGWGLSIAPETINLTARALTPETLYFGNNIRVQGKPNAEWNQEITRNSVMNAIDIYKWIVLFTDKDKRVTTDFLETLKRCCGPMGIRVNNPDMIRLPNDRVDSYVTALQKCITPGVQLIVTICPNIRDDRYEAIKKICCSYNPVPSQVINARTIMNSNKIRAVTQKILLQINCKLGGTLWNIAVPYKTVMIIGIDSYHDINKKHRSVYGFVASYNQHMTLWYSRTVFQEKGQEILDSLKNCLVESLTYYHKTNGVFPEKIIIYRDGVGDGQLNLIQKYEIPQMKLSCSSLGKTYNPTLTYIVVQKRINTRIFMKTRDGFDNPHPGTVVDHDITKRDWYDFLIASQKVNQGTVTPTHYVVLADECKMSPDQCQRLTYKMCHLYYNWPGTVRVPAPCQYAHKLAHLVGKHIRVETADVLADKLYFL